MTPGLDVALVHARRGRAILPLHGLSAGACSCPRGAQCPAAGKHPLTRAGVHDATTAEPVIRGWWATWPHARAGMATGAASGLVVLDVDPRHGGDDALHDLEQHHGALPTTLTVCTPSGGQHIYFRDPAALRPSAGRVGSGLDVRADASYVVAAGTPGYVVDLDAPPASLPTWLEQLARGSTPAAASRAAEVPAIIPEGTRRAALLSLAGTLRRRGLTASEMLPTLRAVNRRRARPPLPEQELGRIAADVAQRYAPREPLTGSSGGWPLGRSAAPR
ncbi:MAG TPA: bifunctional DNA primase/polymerase [Solirubrobacteraceae bacterium]|jgi:putative DNA primase/helicase